MIRKRHRKNFDLLLQYLKSLPEDYEGFDMGNFRGGEEWFLDVSEEDIMLPLKCGTSACMLGFAPIAGVEVHSYANDWTTFCLDQFGLELGTVDYKWEYLFSEDWVRRDNTLAGGIKRLEYYLDNDGNIPDDFCIGG